MLIIFFRHNPTTIKELAFMNRQSFFALLITLLLIVRSHCCTKKKIAVMGNTFDDEALPVSIESAFLDGNITGSMWTLLGTNGPKASKAPKTSKASKAPKKRRRFLESEDGLSTRRLKPEERGKGKGSSSGPPRVRFENGVCEFELVEFNW